MRWIRPLAVPLLAAAGILSYFGYSSHFKFQQVTPARSETADNRSTPPTLPQGSPQLVQPSTKSTSESSPAGGANSQSLATGRESPLKSGIFPFSASAQLGEAVVFDNEIDSHACFPLVSSGQVVAWVYRAYSTDGQLLMQRCEEYAADTAQKESLPPALRVGGLKDHWDRVTASENPTGWQFSRIEAPDWGRFAQPKFCSQLVAYWGLRSDSALTAYVYDITSHSIVLSRAIGRFDIATDNSEAIPEPNWSQACDAVFFDPRPAAKPMFQLKLKAAEMQWKAFLDQPSVSTYQPLSSAIRTCVATNCRDAAVAGSEDNFANLYRLLRLTEHGNHFAMEITFQLQPLYENAAAPSEDIDNGLGLSATRESRFFLELIQKYDIPKETLETLVVQTSRESIDNIRAQRNELRSRIASLLNVTDPGLLQVRDNTISLIQLWLDKYSTLPDNADAK